MLAWVLAMAPRLSVYQKGWTDQAGLYGMEASFNLSHTRSLYLLLRPSHWQFGKHRIFFLFSAILMTDYLIPNAGLYFCAFSLWRLLYSPKLQRHL